MEIAGSLPLQTGTSSPRRKTEIWCSAFRSAGVYACEEGDRINAFTSTCDGPDRGRHPALVGQSLHTDAGNDQVYFECSGGHLRSFVATKRFRTISLFLPDPRWGVSKP